MKKHQRSRRGLLIASVSGALMGFATVPALAAGNPFPCPAPDWTELDGTNGVSSAIRLPSGSVVFAGSFTSLGGVSSEHIGLWDGANFSAMGAGISGPANDMVVHPGGDLIVAGDFVQAGGIAANHIARWDGFAWHPIGNGFAKPVNAVETMDDGSLVACTLVYDIPPLEQPRYFTYRWDGTAWNTFLTTSAPLRSLARDAKGNLHAGGYEQEAFWNGVTWSVASWKGRHFDFVRLWDGEVALAWDQPVFQPSSGVSRLDAPTNTWAKLPWSPSNAHPYSLEKLANGDLIVGGSFYEVWGGVPASNIARWDGTGWNALGTGVRGSVIDLATMPGGALLAIVDRFGGSNSVYVYTCPASGCYADCDESGSLTIDDFICFQTLFAIGDPAADCDESGSLEIDDFICFQTAFAVGC